MTSMFTYTDLILLAVTIAFMFCIPVLFNVWHTQKDLKKRAEGVTCHKVVSVVGDTGITTIERIGGGTEHIIFDLEMTKRIQLYLKMKPNGTVVICFNRNYGDKGSFYVHDFYVTE